MGVHYEEKITSTINMLLQLLLNVLNNFMIYYNYTHLAHKYIRYAKINTPTI